MELSLLAKVPIIITLGVALKVAFITPHQPDDPSSDSEKYGSADHISRIAHWFPWVGVVSRIRAFPTQLPTMLTSSVPRYHAGFRRVPPGMRDPDDPRIRIPLPPLLRPPLYPLL